MKIIFLDFDDIKNPLLAGGQARATFEVANRLVALGHEVKVICSRYPNSKDGKYQGIYYHHIGLGTGNIKINNIAFFFYLPFTVRKLKADVMVECFTAPISTCFSPVFTKIPVIGMPTMFEAEEFSKKYHLPFHWVERFGARFYKYFLAYSPLNKKKMESLNPKIITRIIPNGVDERFFKIPTREDNFALFIGRIDINQKGLDLLLKAFRKIYQKTDINLIIAGNGPKPEEDKLNNLITKLNLPERVRFVGRVDGKRKELLLSTCLFGVYPSRFEDFPLTPLEYASFGKPLVCFDIPGLKWLHQDVSVKARPFDIRGLSKAILEVSRNQTSRNDFQIKCRDFAKKYGWKNIAQNYEDFFQEVLDIEKKQTQGGFA